LFEESSKREAVLTGEGLRQRKMGVVFGGALVLSFIASAVFALFMGPGRSLAFGAATGFAAGLCWVAASFGTNNYLFEHRSLRLFLIDGGYHTVRFTLIGAIVGALS
jgi:Protein of unknown function (DUF1761)